MALENVYRPMQNRDALKRLAVTQHTPNPNLNIGENEDLRSKPVLVFTDAYANYYKVAEQDSTKRPIENSGICGDGITVSEQDFVNGEMFLGYPVEVV